MKKKKEQVTLMACRKPQTPFAFHWQGSKSKVLKHKATLLVVHISQKNAWADAAIFTDWFNCHFVSSVKKHLIQRGLTPKALLLLIDNAPAHPDCSALVSQDKAIKAMFLPPNTTALIQPMDQGFWKH